MINNRDAFLESNKFTSDKLDQFPQIYHDIINFYSIAYDGESRSQLPINWNDLEKLLQLLCSKKELLH